MPSASRRWRWVRWLLVLAVTAAVAVVARPLLYLARTAARDRGQRPEPPPGFVDDASGMNATAVAEILVPADAPAEAEAQLVALVHRAAADGLRISIAGARHTMGGHTIYPGGIVIDMLSMNDMRLDEGRNLLWVQAGARWSEIIPYLDARGRSVAIMQSNNTFTVGGSVSANCHGWPPGRPPIASTVESFRLLTADGSILMCSREVNGELFSLALGGYGLFGVILDLELRVVPNERYRATRSVVGTDAFASAFARLALDADDVALAFGRLRVTREAFLEEAILTVFSRPGGEDGPIPALHEPGFTALKRAVFRGSAGSDYGKRLRWRAEKAFGQQLGGRVFSRNQLLNEGVELYQDRSAGSTDILHEYFVPPGQFASFITRARAIIPARGGDLLNATVRHVRADPDAFLRYADGEFLAVVMLFSQARTPEADAAMAVMTGELIDAALAAGGRYYLPYRLHATPAQFRAAYPQADRFFALKRGYDPQEIFQNRFYLKYGGSRR